MPGTTSRPWHATSSSAGSTTPSRPRRESAASAGPRRNWRKASAGPAAGRDADTASAPAASGRVHVTSLRLDHCVIHVSDWETSNAFYREVLGAELVRNGERWAYRFGAQQLNVHGPGVDATPVARLPVQPGNSDLCFVYDGPTDRSGARGAGRSVYFRDPDGSLLEFISYP